MMLFIEGSLDTLSPEVDVKPIETPVLTHFSVLHTEASLCFP
jgi:hypothetical protein